LSTHLANELPDGSYCGEYFRSPIVKYWKGKL
jgi:hypothetical protein